MKVNQDSSEGTVIPGATNLEELALQPDNPPEPEIAPEETEDEYDLGPAEDAVQGDPGDESDNDPEEPVSTPTRPQEPNADEVTRQAIAYLKAQGIEVPESRQEAAEDDDPEPDRWDNEGADHDAWLIRQAVKQMAPVMAPQLQSQAIAVVKAEMQELGMTVTPEMEAVIALGAKQESVDNLRGIASNPQLAMSVAASYVKHFRANPVKGTGAAQAAKAPAQVVVKGVASAPAGVSGARSTSVEIPRELAPHYKQFVARFKLKDTNAQRKEYLESAGYRG